MPKYQYAGVSPTNEPVRGRVSADTMASARMSLVGDGIALDSLEEKAGFFSMQIGSRERKVPMKEVLHFSRQLGAFVQAGVPIIDSIQTIYEESGSAGF
ncbi:MAG TPA: hypothetical protein VMY34_02365, partial [Acidimicrobiales bacterium]|nr:hypothetical protein [Acidimicrobiales bacterium]